MYSYTLETQPDFIGSKTECALLGFIEKLDGKYEEVTLPRCV